MKEKNTASVYFLKYRWYMKKAFIFKFVIAFLILLSCIASAGEIDELYDAIEKDDLGKVKTLFQENPQLIGWKSGSNNKGFAEGWTVLHYAAWRGHKEIAKYFISMGVDVNAKDKCAVTPLLYASGSMPNFREAINIFHSAEGDIKIESGDRVTPLHSQAKEEVVKMLILKGADVNARITMEGQH